MTEKAKPKPPDPVPAPEHLLGKLDANTQLVATTHEFVIRRLKKVKGADVWETQEHYSDIKSAFQGWYGKRALREKTYVGGVQGDLKKLIKVIEKLRGEVAVVGDKLDLEWRDKGGKSGLGRGGSRAIHTEVKRLRAVVGECRDVIDTFLGDSDIDGDESAEYQLMLRISRVLGDEP